MLNTNIFDMLQCLVVPYICPANHATRVQIGNALGSFAPIDS